MHIATSTLQEVKLMRLPSDCLLYYLIRCQIKQWPQHSYSRPNKYQIHASLLYTLQEIMEWRPECSLFFCLFATRLCCRTLHFLADVENEWFTFTKEYKIYCDRIPPSFVWRQAAIAAIFCAKNRLRTFILPSSEWEPWEKRWGGRSWSITCWTRRDLCRCSVCLLTLLDLQYNA